MEKNTDTNQKREELRAQLAAIAGKTTLQGQPLKKTPDFQGRQTEALAVAQDSAVFAKSPEMTQFLGPEEMQSLEALGQALPGIDSSAKSAGIPTRAEAMNAPIAGIGSLTLPESASNAGETGYPAEALAQRKAAPTRILLTGRSGVGKSWLAAQVPLASVVELTDSIDRFLREFYPDTDPAALAAFRDTVKVWGDGVITDKYPLSPARFLFTEYAKQRWPGFGTPSFWVSLFTEASGFAEKLIVTRVESSADFRALVAAGFSHFHVVTSTNTMAARQQRKNANNQLALSLDADVIKKLSNNRQGPRLNVIWNDNTPASPRVFTVAQWLEKVSVENQPQTGE